MNPCDPVAAWDQAARAAGRRGLRVAELRTIAEFERVVRLFDGIWHPEPWNPPITAELMRALSHAGGYVAGAFEGRELVGAAVAFLAAPAGQALHSHVTGAVRPGAGFALKLHQRAWALERGLSRITWTFDPLVRRNAHFNLAKLAALPEEYLPDFYGSMGDAVNAGDESDRVLVVWRPADPRVVRACDGLPHRPAGADDAVAVLADRDGLPVALPADGPAVLVAVPADVETLRRTAPETAKAWRHAVRDVLGGLMARGRAVTGFAGGCYVVERRSPAPE
ncbi:GNAT family N-acetyltransferase [Microbispora hainanensis]|uniref:GNAT family N-acetyltransferase n=1 Tax=Microbispora hainanensis TaxID=568844 RepID=A0A544YUH9_9ACTN|nr:GNAT family N-acetyltransferase [Microbispora hainanensis]TQS20435.1 GNAT family N-acetyltransferase [Microbispora hainanensis]